MNNIIFLILAFISYYFLVLVFGKISNKRFNINLYSIIIIVTFSVINSLSFMDNLLFVKTIISILIFILINLLIYKSTIKESIVCSILYLLMTLFAELVVLLILSPFNVISEKYITSISTLKAAVTVVVMITTYLIVSINKINKLIYKIYRFFVDDKKYTRYIIITIFITTFICLLYIINYSKKNLFIMNLLFYLTFLLIVYLIARSIHKNKKLNIVNELLLNNEESYIKVIESYQLFKHNIIHEFNCIKSVGNKKVNDIIDGYIKEHQTPVIDEKVLCSIPKSIRTIIYNNIIKNSAYSLNISVDSYIKNDIINVIATNTYMKLSEILGIIIDNSIEACENTSNPYLYLYLNEDKNKYYINVVNDFSNDIYLFDDTKTNKSTKNGHTGLGLKYVFNSKFDVKTTIRNNKFITKIIIKK